MIRNGTRVSSKGFLALETTTPATLLDRELTQAESVRCVPLLNPLFQWIVGFAITGLTWAGPLTRVPNTTLQLPEVPGGFGYRFVEAFPGLTLDNPVAIAAPPGETNRLFIVEQRGRIIVITNLAAPTRTVFLDLTKVTVYGGEQGLLGLAFHPGYATNGTFFTFRTLNWAPTGASPTLHERLSRFRVQPDSPHQASAASEIWLFQEIDDYVNHNGGDLHFGPDGYLYVSLGDEGAANDAGNNSQRIDGDFFSGMLRLDVDRRPGSLPPNPHGPLTLSTNFVSNEYAIPADNPYVGATSFNGKAVNAAKVRTEFYAVGLRNPWRFSFDEANGELWIGDVGQDRWESVYVTRRGANHGWAFREGAIAGAKSGMPAGFMTNPDFNYVPPVFTYAHGSGADKGNSLTGGFVYRGTRLAQLFGAYVFSDYVSGNVWALQRRVGAAPAVTRLLGKTGISAFGVDPRNGDVLAADLSGARLLRLDYSPTFTGAELPPTLAETGALADLVSLEPAAGFVPYAVNQAFWSDGAEKRRWFCVPATNDFLVFNPTETWGAPRGTTWMKHFDLELTNGIPESRRRLETRFLVRNSNGVYGVTYRWNSATNAVLVAEAGEDEVITRVINGAAYTQSWHYPSRAECLACHNRAAGYSLSFNSAQLNREFGYPEGVTNQLTALIAAGYFGQTPVPVPPLPPLAAIADEAVSLEWRARSYLAVNCAPCHRPSGIGNGFFDARLENPTALTGLINGSLNDSRGDSRNRVLVPGSQEHSVLLQRQSIRGLGQMPPLASSVADAAGSELLARWIAQLVTAPEPQPAGLTSSLANRRLNLHIQQPANQSVYLEATDDLNLTEWRSVPVSGLSASYPAEAREVIVETEITAESKYFRTKSNTP